MDLFLVFIIISTLIGIKIHFKDFNKEYLSKNDTSCIKGIFILVVFFSHFVAYDNIPLPYNNYMLGFRDFLGQLMVSLFMFYSGYGVLESIKNKKNYVQHMPKKRIIKTLFHFDIAVLSFLVVDLFINKTYGLKTILLSFVGWDTIGNSNWYIFSIICLYLITYISFTIFDKNKKISIISTCILTYIFMLFLEYYKEPYWYCTLFCYLLGMIYSYYKNDIYEMISGSNKKYFLYMFSVIFAFCVFRKIDNIYYYNYYSIFFCLIVVGITMKVHLNSKVLKWFGDNLFWIYILQRIPMIILYNNNYYI